MATGMIYFGYRLVPVYRFGFTAIIYIYITNNKCEFWDYCYLKKYIYILIVYINYMFINLII